MYNKVILIGNLGKDPETKKFDNNQVTNFSLATSETYKDKSGNKVTNTEWHSIVLWGKLSEIAESYVKKGDKVCIEGKIKTETYEHEGVMKYKTTIVGTSLVMLSNKSEEATKQGERDLESVGKAMEQDDDLPF